MPNIVLEFLGTEENDGLVGSILSDEITGFAGDDLLVGLNGDDTLDGGEGDDILDGGIGDDLVTGGSGDDKIMLNMGDDVAFGGAGDDVYFVNGWAGDYVFINDTEGTDTLNFYGGITGAVIDLTPGATSYVDGRDIVLGGFADEGATALDLVLLQDLSGSFGDDLATVNGLVDDLIASVTGLADSVRLGVASFVDKPISPFGSASSGDYEYLTNLGLTSDADVWKDTVTDLSVFFGSDGPESQLTGLMQVALRGSEVGWSSDATKVVVLTTDAIPHMAGDHPVGDNDGDDVTDGPGDDGTEEDYPTIAQVKAALLDAGVLPVFAVTDGVTDDYEAIVAELGFGVVVPLSSDSSDIISAFEDGIEGATEALIENAIGTMYKDYIVGNSADNMIKGKAGNDKIFGEKGDDSLYGGKGKDKIEGGKGDDTIEGGAGKDKLTGDQGADMFVFDMTKAPVGKDTVTDFDDGVDMLEIQDVIAGNFFTDVVISSVGGGSDTLVEYLGESIAVLKGVDSALITEDDFIFSIA